MFVDSCARIVSDVGHKNSYTSVMNLVKKYRGIPKLPYPILHKNDTKFLNQKKYNTSLNTEFFL